jgi:uncharacterized protein (UPF0335 family)
MELIKKIESNIAELEAKAKKNGEFVSNASATIERLNSEKATILDETNRIMGAIQAFRFVLNEQQTDAPVMEIKSKPKKSEEKKDV